MVVAAAVAAAGVVVVVVVVAVGMVAVMVAAAVMMTRLGDRTTRRPSAWLGLTGPSTRVLAGLAALQLR
jgi:NADH:ubiquinone oxidoreductase subunit 6 (subunit J)